MHNGDDLISNGLPDSDVSAKSEDPRLASADQSRGKVLAAFEDEEIMNDGFVDQSGHSDSIMSTGGLV